MKYSAISLGLLTAFGAYAQDNVPAQPREVVTIEANTPLMQTTDSKQLIGSKQTITSADLGLTPTRSLGEVLRNQFRLIYTVFGQVCDAKTRFLNAGP